MKSPCARWFGSISFTVLLVSSVYILANSTVSRASTISNDEVTAASGSNRFVVWVNELGRDTEIFFRRSTDNGASWQPKVSLAPSPMEAFNPQIIVSGSNVYVVWGEFHSNLNIGFVIFIRSTDNGATWGPVQEVSESCSNFFSPQIAVSGSNVYVVWHSGGGECQSANEIVFIRSTDNGATWHPAVNLSNNPGHSLDPWMAVSGSNVYVVWTQLNVDETLRDVFFRRSTDNGATWKAIKNFSSNGHSSDPDLAVSGSNVYVVWTDDTSGNADTFFRRSTDNGATWKSKVNISNNAGDSFGPQIALAGTSVYVVWSDGTPGNIDIFIRRSTDTGTTWKVAKNLSNNPGPSRFPQIAVSGSYVYVAWTQRNPDQTLSDVFFRRSTDNGATWQASKNLSSNGQSGEQDLVFAGSIVYVVWVNSGTGVNGDIFIRRSIDNGATWQASKNLSSNASGSYSPQIGV